MEKINIVVTDRQVEIIKYLISNFKEGNEEAKKVLLALVDASENFTKRVFYIDGMNKIGEGMNDLISKKEAYLNLAIELTGSKFFFSHCEGRVGANLDELPSDCYLVFLSCTWFSPYAQEIKLEEVSEKVDRESELAN